MRVEPSTVAPTLGLLFVGVVMALLAAVAGGATAGPIAFAGVGSILAITLFLVARFGGHQPRCRRTHRSWLDRSSCHAWHPGDRRRTSLATAAFALATAGAAVGGLWPLAALLLTATWGASLAMIVYGRPSGPERHRRRMERIAGS